jgi:hypothetical protein
MRGMFRLMAPLLLIAAAPTQIVGAELPLRVTTDSSAYCIELVSRFAIQSAQAADASRQLAAEGARLCETGHVRTGIAKLRRALRATQVGG